MEKHIGQIILERVHKKRNIGMRLKAAREYLGQDEAGFAEILHITPYHVSSIENGLKKLHDSMLTALYMKYKINAEWLTEGIGQVVDGVTIEVHELHRSMTDDELIQMVEKATDKYLSNQKVDIKPSDRERIIGSFYYFFYNADKVNYSDVKKAVNSYAEAVVKAIKEKASDPA
jgi:transcriptional regulator with XRE-family HTH domain